MKALKAEAEWAPRSNYSPTEAERLHRKAVSGNMIWKNPSIGVVDGPEPEAGSDELIVKVKYCGICGSDTHVFETDREGYMIFSGPARLPCVLGHEYSGEVVDAGKDVVGFAKGDIIAGESILWCGKCLPCRRGMLNQCENVELMGLTSDGAFAEYVKVKDKYCWKLNALEERFTRDEVFRIGSLIEPLGCAYNGIFISGDGFLPGASAIVYGAGPIGLGSVMLLRVAGAGRIAVVDVIDERLSLAGRLGADYLFNLSEVRDLENSIMDMTSGWGVDIQVEAAGAADVTVPIMQRLCSKRGEIIYLGRAGSSCRIELNRMVTGAHSLIGSRGHSGYGIFQNIIRLFESGRLDNAKELITSEFPFSKIKEAFTLSTKRADGKVLIRLG